MDTGQIYNLLCLFGMFIFLVVCICGRYGIGGRSGPESMQCYLCKVSVPSNEFYGHRLKCNERNWLRIRRFTESKVRCTKPDEKERNA